MKRASAAVMEQRARGEIESDSPEQKLWRALDYYPTPPWAARAIAHRIRQLDPGARTACEPACGEGHFAEPMREVFDVVRASDVYDFGYGEVRDFLHAPAPEADPDWIITNPPFVAAPEFIARGLSIARCGVAMLCRLAFVESVDRYPLLWGDGAPLTTLMPFAERVPMQLGSWDPKLHTATAYAVFCFHKGRSPTPPMGFPPGTRQAYWRNTDAERFAKAEPLPLFDNMAAPPLFAS